MQIKQFKGPKDFELTQFKAVEENGIVKISGYANNKGIADRYGDIPTPFNRTFVYDIAEYIKNPVLMLNHGYGVGSIAGKVTKIFEDERGLYFEAELSQSDWPELKHARTVIREGILKTVSIGGMWLYEDVQNPNHLTLAKIYEISLVAIPADPFATFEQVKGEPKQALKAEEKQSPKEDYKEAIDKLYYYDMEQKLKRFDVQNHTPENAGKEQK